MPSVPDWTDVAQAGGTLVSALTSIMLIYVAVKFRDEVRLARNRPDLTLLYDVELDTLEFRDPNWNFDVHVRVKNKPGQDRAVGVGLELVDVKPINSTAPLQLRPPRRPFVVAELDDYKSTQVDVPSNITRRFLLVYHNVDSSEGGLELALKPRALESKRDILPPGTYELTLALTASNTDATFWTTTVSFLGVSGPSEELPERLTMTSPVRTVVPR